MELSTIEKYEPKLYKAVNNIFHDSYEYTRAYREFKKAKKESNKILKGQMSIEDLKWISNT